MKKFNVGIVGYGWAATAHVPAINAGPLGQVTAVCSARPLDAAELSAKYGSPIRTCSDLAVMLADPAIQVVSITGYPWLHAEQVIAAAKVGKHIIVEKPLALSLAEVRAMAKAVQKAGVRFCICFECLFASQFQAVFSVLQRGLLGPLHYAEVDYYHGIGPWYDEYRWCTKKDGGGSSLLEAGCHAMDALLHCVKDEVESVYSCATGSSHPVFKRYEYPTTSSTLVRFRNGAVGKCASVIDCFQPYYFHTHLVGREGSLLDDKFHSNLLHGLDKNKWSKLAMKLVDSGDVADHPYQTQFDTFFAALERGEEMPLTGLADAVRTHEVIFAADLSARENRPVKLEEIRGK